MSGEGGWGGVVLYIKSRVEGKERDLEDLLHSRIYWRECIWWIA